MSTSVEKKIDKAIKSLERAKKEYNSLNKRKTIASLDYAKDSIEGAFWLLKAELEEDN